MSSVRVANAHPDLQTFLRRSEVEKLTPSIIGLHLWKACKVVSEPDRLERILGRCIDHLFDQVPRMEGRIHPELDVGHVRRTRILGDKVFGKFDWALWQPGCDVLPGPCR